MINKELLQVVNDDLLRVSESAIKTLMKLKVNNISQIKQISELKLEKEDIDEFIFEYLDPISVLGRFSRDLDEELEAVPYLAFELMSIIEDSKHDEKIKKHANIFVEITFKEHDYDPIRRLDYFKECSAVLEKHKYSGIIPEVSGIIEQVYYYNEYAEKNDLPKMGTIMADSENKAENLKHIERSIINKFLPEGEFGDIRSRIGTKDPVREELAAVAAGATAVLTFAALTAMAVAVFKKFNQTNKCIDLKGFDKTKCEIAGIDAAIRSLETQKRLCNRESNPEKCRTKVDKIIAKWQSRKKKKEEILNKRRKKLI